MKKKTMDFILIIVGISILIFTIAMVWLYLLTGGIPDTLCTCFFVACTGECGFMGWIKTAKTRFQEHEWDLEEREHQEELIEKQKEAMKQQEMRLDDILRDGAEDI